MEKRKRYSRKLQRMAVEHMKTCESVGELAKELGVTQRSLYKWRRKLETVEAGEEASRPATQATDIMANDRLAFFLKTDLALPSLRVRRRKVAKPLYCLATRKVLISQGFMWKWMVSPSAWTPEIVSSSKLVSVARTARGNSAVTSPSRPSVS